MQAEDDRSKDNLIHDLNERVKELNCLYGLSKLIETPGITIEGIMKGVAGLLSAAWQYPEITAVRAVLYEEEYISGEWQLVKATQSADIVVEAERRGSVSVGYIEERPEQQEGPFLKEERFLLDTIAERLGRVTERLEIRDAVARSEERYRDLYDNAPNAYYSVGVDGVIKRANRKASELLGFNPVGETLLSLYADTRDGKEKVKGIFERYMSGQRIENEELQMQRSDGGIFWINLSVTPVEDEAGNVRESRSVVIDITDKKTFETYLRVVKEQWENTFRSVSESVFLVNRANTVLQANPAFAELLGMPQEEILGKKCFELVHGVGFSPDACVTCNALVNGEGCVSELYEPNLNRYLSATADPVFGEDGEVTFVVHTLRDITERKQYEEELERANKELEAFSHTVSHDLRAPLASLSMAHSLMEEMLSDKAPELLEEASDVLEICERSLERSTSLIEDLLMLANIGEPTDTYSIGLNEKIKEILFERRSELSRKGIEVKVDDLGDLVANPTHVYQVFNNLMTNAIRYAVSDDPLIEIKRIEENRYLVRDNGPGISEEIIDDIFVPFVKDREGDTGLGLSIVERVVKAYGGQIKAYNDNGACFEFTLQDFAGSSGASASSRNRDAHGGQA